MSKCKAKSCDKEAENKLMVQRYGLDGRIGYFELRVCNEHVELELRSLLKDGDIAVIMVDKWRL